MKKTTDFFGFYDFEGAKPFLKWAGGKTQLIPAISASLPNEFREIDELTYIEPFVGGGAVLFWALRTYPNIKQAFINDINSDLTTAYRIIKEAPHNLISALKTLQESYYALHTEDERRAFFMQARKFFNERNLDPIQQTATLMFLNKTCFNGLYRVNSKNEFNVPFGKYIAPKICDEETILADSALLQKVTILTGDFERTIDYATGNTFFYLDPPYKPISQTASFNSYSKEIFNDDEQIRLGDFCNNLNKAGYLWLLSNSDVKNVDTSNDFFDTLYSNFNIGRVKAKRHINSDSSKRGEISELLISNYEKGNLLISN